MSAPSTNAGCDTLTAAFSECTRPARGRRKKRPHPISIRLSDEERQRLVGEASGQSLNAFIRSKLFGDRRRSRQAPAQPLVQDRALLAQVMRALGQCDITWAMKELDVAVLNGVIHLDLATREAIREACGNIREMRDDLVRALGLRDRP